MRHFVLAFVALAGCGTNPMGATDPAPPAHGYQLKTPDFTLDAGTEKYLCYGVTLNESSPTIAINQFASFASKSVHHFEVFQALSPEPNDLVECGGQLIKTTWMPLFGGGVNAGGLTLPDGAGFVVPGNAQILLQLHMLNATTEPVTQHVIVNMDYAADPTAVTKAGIFAFGSQTINLPAHSKGTVVTSPACPMTRTMNIFAVQPHMHLLGTSISLATGSDAHAMNVAYARDPWVFGVQPIDQFSLNLATNTLGQATCTFDNTTDSTVTYGESTKNEMCYFVVFYTPFTGLDGCLN